jgi:uncharacterized tellurite resistance protein B-like protein
MHVLLGILGAVVTILILLNRLAEAGIDLGGLNPFLWQRRKRWRDKLEGNPVYHVDSPMEAAALLVVAAAKTDGDVSAEEKKTILALFQDEFRLSKREAAGLFVSSAYLLGKGEEVQANLEKVMKPSLDNFSAEQAQSALKLLERVCGIEPAQSELKREFVARVRTIFDGRFGPQAKWR